ncbi:nucleoside triphosphate pyrophosphohydrolase, partial [Streptomyces sp. URMC 123]
PRQLARHDGRRAERRQRLRPRQIPEGLEGLAGLDVKLPGAGHPEDFGTRLLELAVRAEAAGVDPESALRAAARAYRDAIRTAELTE